MKKLTVFLSVFAAISFISACAGEVDNASSREDQTEGNGGDTAEVNKEAAENAEEAGEEVKTEVEAYLRNHGAYLESVDIFPSIELSGSGSGSDVFEVQYGGVVFFEMANKNSSSNYIVTIDSIDTGDRMASVANEIGNYEGKRIQYLEPGEYILQTKSDGDWTMVINQPFSGEIHDQREFAGSGSYSIGPIALNSGTYELLAKHSGDSNFIVSVVDILGDKIASAFNEIGDYEGNYISASYDGMVLYFDIVADGEWEFKIEN
ncbi:hypothetical protein [Shouchella clausii]|uniref:hypothetical protein n=1 Tax=Shouchella clausii TaxID=79880 RepID=UPI000BA7A4F4|nr:hypothetical protein [Shouchella clausii]PAD19132.1 hypothetical protein CHH73_03455 [Shouchella clausii]